MDFQPGAGIGEVLSPDVLEGVYDVRQPVRLGQSPGYPLRTGAFVVKICQVDFPIHQHLVPGK